MIDGILFYFYTVFLCISEIKFLFGQKYELYSKTQLAEQNQNRQNVNNT